MTFPFLTLAMLLVVRLLFLVDLTARPQTFPHAIRFDSRRSALLGYRVAVIMRMCVSLAPA